MLGIFLAEQGFISRYLPVDAEGGVKNADAAICLWMIEFVALILEDCCLTKHSKAVSEATGNKEL